MHKNLTHTHSAFHVSEALRVHVGLLEVPEAGIRFKVWGLPPICLKPLGDKREKEGLSPLKVQRFQRRALLPLLSTIKARS